MNATGLRREVGKHAKTINEIIKENKNSILELRETIGHLWVEIFGGLILGIIIGISMNVLF
jgi:acid phosphatase family membrane protein YuiD